MAKVISFPNLATPTGAVFASLADAVTAGIAATNESANRVRGMAKVERRDYLKVATTNWPCISLTEGVNPTLRISGDNPPQLLHGFMADFDNVGKKFTLQELADLASRCAYPPTAAGSSLSGDGVHAVWVFKEPIPVLGNSEYARKVTNAIYTKLRVSNFMQGFDDGFKKPDRLLSIDPGYFGYVTPQEAAQVVDEVSTRMWASSVISDFKFEGQELDLVKVYEQVQKLFPGRWAGDFNVGARGCRFWDATASDPTAAMVTATGMVYFSDGGGFKPWSSILGGDVTTKLTAESLKEVTAPWFYDDSKKEYIYLDSIKGDYHCKTRTQTLDRFSLAGLEDELEKKRALAYIEDYKCVAGVIALANQRKGILTQANVTYINATQTTPMVAVEGECPFIDGLLQTMFGPEQLDYFLAWLQDSLRCMQAMEPSYSQTLFLAGDVACGKTLLQTRFLTPLFGGKSADPMPHLLGEGGGFNAELADAGHWMVSDAEGARNAGQRASFTQKVKAIAANPEMSVNPKYRTPVTLMLNSRLTFSFNLLDECLGVLPRMGHDILDKLHLFLIPKHNYFDNLDPRITTSSIASELPAFAYWLLNFYTPPANILNAGGRYRVKSYHSPLIMRHAKASQDSSELLGWLNIVFDQNETLKKLTNEEKAAEFSATGWLQVINQTLATAGGGQLNMTSQRLSTHLQSLARQYPEAVSVEMSPRQKVFMFSVDYTKLVKLEE